jgi:hypothetical protein
MNSNRRDEGNSRGRRRIATGAITLVGIAGLVFGVVPVIGGIVNEGPTPAAESPVATVVATKPQVAGGSASASSVRKSQPTKVIYKQKPALLDSRISTEPLVTEEGKGSFVGLKCPKYFKAVAGGVLSQYINLVVSSSSPNNPVDEKFTPNTWWLAVTNINTDGQGGSLSWRGVVSCMKPVKLQQG